mmetsp:Transcript_35395/g.87974  ORF Transcript_35395/g.87974 Transcript_35395/m.87974 type:complete len:437 (-) Transcript_35395:386-1696(-)
MGCRLSCTSEGGLRDEYILGQKIGEGAFAQVRLCTHKKTGEKRCVKLLHKPYPRQDFETEIAIMEEVCNGGCDNIVRFYQHYEDNYFYYSVMENLSGGELFDTLASPQPLTEMEIADIMRQMLTACAYIHKVGIVHRDLKPQNLLFAAKGSNVVKMIDFGLSYKMPKGEMLDDPCGTPEFVAPEMILGKYGSKVDIWACGVILFMMLFGEMPFAAANEEALWQRIVEHQPDFKKVAQRAGYNPSEGALDLLKKLLTKKPRHRPTAEEAARHKWIKEMTQPTAMPVLLEPIPQDVRRKGRLATIDVKKKHDEMVKQQVPHPPQHNQIDKLQEELDEEYKHRKQGRLASLAVKKQKETDGAHREERDSSLKVPPAVEHAAPPTQPAVERGEERKTTRTRTAGYQNFMTELEKLRAQYETIKEDSGELDAMGPVDEKRP